jgi:ATP/ADP translocase
MLLICIGVFTIMFLIASYVIYRDNKRLKNQETFISNIQKDKTDFLNRLNNGEVLSKDNIF